jgi:hypothetical protein
MKCVVWSPQGLDLSISLPLGFLTPNIGFHILSALSTTTKGVHVRQVISLDF